MVKGILSKLNIIIVLLFLVQSKGFAETFKIATVKEIKYFQDVERKVALAYDNLDIQYKVVPMPAERALIEADKSDWVDAVLARVDIQHQHLKEYLKVPVVLREVGIIAFSRQAIKIKDWKDLADKNTVSIKGLILIEDKIKQFQLDTYKTTTANQVIEMVKSGRVEIGILPKDLYPLIKRSFGNGDVFNTCFFFNFTYGTFFNRFTAFYSSLW